MEYVGLDMRAGLQRHPLSSDQPVDSTANNHIVRPYLSDDGAPIADQYGLTAHVALYPAQNVDLTFRYDTRAQNKILTDD